MKNKSHKIINSKNLHLEKISTEIGKQYVNAEPYPHVVIDDFFDNSFLDKVLNEFPDLSKEGDSVQFKDGLSIKLASNINSKFRDNTLELLNFLNSKDFLFFLQKVTGIKETLLPDPYYVGGGLHEIKKNGFLKIHSDFNYHPMFNLDRRLNLLVYLNKNWQEKFGGQFEMWDKNLHNCVKKVEPLFNRIVIFSTTNESFHGHPDPLNCPDNISRKSIALYYYSNGRPEHEKTKSRSTLYVNRKNTNEVNYTKYSLYFKLMFINILKNICPPFLIKLKNFLFK